MFFLRIVSISDPPSTTTVIMASSLYSLLAFFLCVAGVGHLLTSRRGGGEGGMETNPIKAKIRGLL
jgi:hypothetical protein